MDQQKMGRGRVGSSWECRREWGTGLVAGRMLLGMWVLTHQHESLTVSH